jgi:hypothetical protein
MSDDPNESDGHKIERGLYAVATALERIAEAIGYLHEDLKEDKITFHHYRED